MSSTQDVRFAEGSLEEGRKLANKLWNVARLLSQHEVEPAERPSSVEERWILARIEATRREIETAWSRFDFSPAVQALYRLTFDDFCDWYAEAIKPRLGDGRPDAAATALAALETLLKLLHPVMPHVTEEIWSQFPADTYGRLIVSPWPEPDDALRRDVDRARARPGGGRDLPPQRRARRARGRRRADLRGRRPSRARAGERERRGRDRAPAARRSSAARGMLANEKFVERRARGGRGRAREARPPTGASSMPSAADWVASLSPVAGGVRPRADAGAPRRPRRSAARLPVDPRRRHERQVDGDADDRGAAARRGAPRRRHRLAARARLGGADHRRRRGGRPRGGARARAAGRRGAARRSSR